jgi:maltooligosyltrehalose trehalohydrolase
MGQEWAATAPFLYFTDHEPELGRLVTEGRRREFRHFLGFIDPQARDRIPDPQSPGTFRASTLDESERTLEPHASIERLYAALIGLRRTLPAFQTGRWESFRSYRVNDDALVLCQQPANTEAVWLVVQLRGSGTVDLSAGPWSAATPGRNWEVILTTEDPSFDPEPVPVRIEARPGELPTVEFGRPGAVLLQGRGIVE